MPKNLREQEYIQSKLEYTGKELRVFIVDLIPKKSNSDFAKKRLEVENLVNTYGGVIILKYIQKRTMPDYNTYIGKGKLDEIIDEMKLKDANLIIFSDILKPHQIYNINEKLKKIGAKSWDRIDLILKIFEKNAKTTESRLQIELASIKHMGPRIFDMGMELGNQGRGGSKLSRGKGETNTEIMKRHLKQREERIKKSLDKYKKTRNEHRKSRKQKGFFTVGIVGYTNAGKSSLMNKLTKKGVLSENKLFATLGTSVGKMYLEGLGSEVLINDTIGFIQDLPPNLIEAFSSTLEDSIESDLLLQVVYINDESFSVSETDIDNQIHIVDKILGDINAKQEKIYIFNKIDLISKKELVFFKEKYEKLNSVFLSTYNGEGIEELKKEIVKKLY